MDLIITGLVHAFTKINPSHWCLSAQQKCGGDGTRYFKANVWLLCGEGAKKLELDVNIQTHLKNVLKKAANNKSSDSLVLNGAFLFFFKN